MKALNLCCLICGLFYLSINNSYGQRRYSFEEDNKWSSRDTILWSLSDEVAVEGSHSLRYAIKENTLYKSSALISIETDHTIMKVRTAKDSNGEYIVGTSYEGIVIGVGYDGMTRWKAPLSGIMNHDLWCQDITGDGVDEILVANADGHIYCLDNKGELMWQFKVNEAPMYAVTVINKENIPYVVCGGMDMSIYYLSASGQMIKEIKSSTYSIERPWNPNGNIVPDPNLCTANFIRPINKPDGSEVLAVNGTNNHMNVPGTMYMFEPLADLPYRKDKISSERVIGDFRMIDMDNDGELEIYLGVSGHTNDAGFSMYNQTTGESVIYPVTKKLGTGYLITQAEQIKVGSSSQLMVWAGSNIFLLNSDLNMAEAENLSIKYAFNDLWKGDNDKIILASQQSGGNCIHILDTQNPEWKTAYKNFKPKGKIADIIENTKKMREKLKNYSKPSTERDPLPVYLMTENLNSTLAASVANNIKANYESPIFLSGKHSPKVQSPESWNRDTISNAKYRDKRDRRRQYVNNQDQVEAVFKPEYDNNDGLATWGGHGNDPFFYSPKTLKSLIDYADGKKTVFIYPELESHSDDFRYVLDNLLYPLSEYGATRNANMYIRTKNIFWLGTAHMPMWSRLLSGEFAKSFVPAMEETTDKTMELSLAGRVGIWASGAVDNWGTRAIMDNVSYDRSREVGYQRLPNHFLRMLVYHISYGANYLNNFAVDQDYISVLYELIAKGALYVPKREEIVSFSPVHVSMKEPNEHYINEGANVKWTTFYDKEFEDNNAYVFSRMNGTWPGAPVTNWDFSRYAAGVKDRRLNFLPPYKNGLVLITPPQQGVFADSDAPRGQMVDHLHPLYKNILKEYVTDGHKYFSKDGLQSFEADEYYATIENDILEGSKKIPLTVLGDEVAWVVAQTSPKHLRLTIIDGGYVNPGKRKAKISFHNVSPVKMTDILDGKNFDISNPASVEVDVPCGLFRFIDIELTNEL